MYKANRKSRVSHEHNEQVALMRWIIWAGLKYEKLNLLFAIPNGGERDVRVATRLKAEGVKSGIPDLFLPVPSRRKHGLFIEMKYGKNKPSENQKAWIENLKKQNYKVEVCYSHEEAIAIIIDYLNLPIKSNGSCI